MQPIFLTWILTGNVALVIGSEAGGVSEAAVRNADLLVRIPMAGRAESLNVSVAAGIMMFEAVRQKKGYC
ncbi:MAG: TrmH family RNA methyltransferase [Acetivibrionales bacterium]